MAPPVTTGLDPLDAALDESITKFFLLKESGAGNIGTNDDPNQPYNNYFSAQDIGVLQSSVLLQPINNAEFREGTPLPNNQWVDFLTDPGGNPTKTQSFGFAPNQVNITWNIVGGMNPSNADLRSTEQNFATATLQSLEVDDKAIWQAQFVNRILLRAQLVKADQTFQHDEYTEIVKNVKKIRDDGYTVLESFDTRFYNQFADNTFEIINDLISDRRSSAESLMQAGMASFDGINSSFENLKSTLWIVVGDPFTTTIFDDFKASTPYENLLTGVTDNFKILSGLNLTGLYSQVTGNEFNNGDIVSVTPEGLEFSPPPAASFTDLLDTPADIVPSGFVRGDKDGVALEYSDINLVSGDIKDVPIPSNLPNGSGYLYANWSQGAPVLSWSPSTAGNVTINSVGSEFFTGLLDTPSNYQNGLFLSSSAAGIVYSDINNKLVSFTGLSDTPDVFSQDKFLKSSAGALEFTDAPPYQFTGLTDTPASYVNSNGQYLRVKNNSIEFVDITGEIDSSGLNWSTYLRSGDLPPAADNAGMFTLVELGVPSGAYVSDGQEWHKIFPIDPSTVVPFTGLTDTPSSYANASGKYLRVKDTEDGVEFFDPILSFSNIDDLPANPPSGRLATVGCDLYIGCEGAWVEFEAGGNAVPDLEEFPDCIGSQQELNQYIEYRGNFLAEQQGQAFAQALNGDPQDLIREVCLFIESNLPQERNSVKIEESTYKWGIFANNQDINITATPFNDPNGSICTFKEWKSSDLPTFPRNNAQETIFIDRDASITGCFECTVGVDEPICSEVEVFLQPVLAGGDILDKSSHERAVAINGDPEVNDNEELFSEPTMYFDGVGDALGIGDKTTFKWIHDYSSVFTIECWFNVEQIVKDNAQRRSIHLLSTAKATSASDGFSLYINNAGLQFAIYNRTANLGLQHPVSDADILGKWMHVAVTWDGQTGRLYVDGDLKHSGSPASVNVAGTDSFSQLFVGYITPHGMNNPFFKGSMQGIRISKKVVYPSNFVARTALLENPCPDQPECNEIELHLQATANPVSDLSDFQTPIENGVTTNAGVFTPGNVIVDSTAPLFGQDTINFPGGAADMLSAGNAFNFLHDNTTDYTIELWLRLDELGANNDLLGTIRNSSGNVGVFSNIKANGSIYYHIHRGSQGTIFKGINSSAGVISAGQWHHIAFVNQIGQDLKLYIDGISLIDQGNGYTPGNASTANSTRDLYIGCTQAAQSPINGQMQDFRISKKAVYLKNFTRRNSLLINPC